jgi:hypothetical protein
MLIDYENIIIDKVFTTSEIDDLYNYIESQPEEIKMVHNRIGYLGYMCGVPENIFKKMEQVAADNLGMDLTLTEISFSRYIGNSNKTPVLHPHIDDFDGARITVDVQVRSNTEWSLFVEGREYMLQDNQALVFAGTHQVHWRDSRVLEDGEVMDMLFCHFTVNNNTDNTTTEERKARQQDWIEKINGK